MVWRVWVLLAGLLIAMSVAVVLPQAQQHRFTRSASTSDDAVTERFEIWSTALEKFEESPIEGLGIGGVRGLNVRGRGTHNAYLEIVTELGVVGAGLFGFLLAGAWLRAGRSKSTANAYHAVLMAWLVTAMWLNSAFYPVTWLVLGFMWAQSRFEQESEPENRLGTAENDALSRV